MKFSFLRICLLLFAGLAAACAESEPAPLTKAELAAWQAPPEDSLTDFNAYLEYVAGHSENEALRETIALYRENGGVTGVRRANIARLMGLYTRLAYSDELVPQLKRLVEIPTPALADVPNHENPGIIRFGEEIEAMAVEFGLDFENVDNRVFVVSLPGKRDEWLGLFTHGDVVPADPEKWVLDDGTRLDPYTLTRIDDRLYGRGAEDDKSPIVSAFYAMRALERSNLPRVRGVKLVIETTEETTQAGTEYYKDHAELPDHNLVLDGSYPLGVAEKGFGTVWAHFPVRTTEGPAAVRIEGALATNQIPSEARVQFCCIAKEETVNGLYDLAEAVVNEHGGAFAVDQDLDRLSVVFKGDSAHSSEPQSGLNPVPRLFLFVHRAREADLIDSNHLSDAARYVAENWGIDYLGNVMGVAYSDEFMGPLTASVTYAGADEEEFRVAVNLRAPRGKEPDALSAEIRGNLDDWFAETGIDGDFSVEVESYMVRDPSGAWIEEVSETFTGITGLDGTPRSDAGSTTAKQLPMGVSFGPSWPGQKYTGHNANEFKRYDNFLLDTQIYTEMVARLTGLESME